VADRSDLRRGRATATLVGQRTQRTGGRASTRARSN
jgi:hypothetical protein